MASLLNISSSRLVESKVLPYDAEIEYLESTGTQYIDTLINNTSDLEFYIKLDNTKEPADLRVINRGYFGTIGVWGNFLGCYRNNSTFYWVRPNWYYSGNENGLIEAYCGLDNIVVNGVTGAKKGDSGNTYRGTINLFRGMEGYTQIKMYYIQIYKNGILVYDAIPVRVGTTGYMYDKVSGTLLGNAGTGSFILGPDKQ